jgi:FkbM family methyltransferase
MAGTVLFYELYKRAYSNVFFRAVWRALAPVNLRLSISTRVHDSNNKAKFSALTKIIVSDIEKGIINCGKAGDILRFLKPDKTGLRIKSADFIKFWFETGGVSGGRFNFNGVFLPDVSDNPEIIDDLPMIFNDTFLIHVLYNDDYSANTVKRLEKKMHEGPYGYTDGAFDVRVKAEDTVIDAGSHIGDFSAYAAAKGALAYAFEPSSDIFEILEKTSKIYEAKIIPVNKGLSDVDGEIEFFSDTDSTLGAGRINDTFFGDKVVNSCKIAVTTLDKFVSENKLERVDFIKADIEGAERNLLAGAKNTLKEFAPKLAICTYHLPDDPKVLERLILEANPKYKVRHGPKKLYACVV